MILGIDEVGRGPWAGPLVVGAVVLGGTAIDGLADSKKLSKKRRNELDVIIRRDVAGYGIGWVSAHEIDEIGLSAALRLATIRAVERVKVPYHEIVIDGTINFLAETTKGKYVTTMPKADALVPSVSAASIIAKVARDNYMAEQDAVYEGYKFASHVGYGTAAHRAAIDSLGVTPLHRLSFAPLAKYAPATAAVGGVSVAIEKTAASTKQIGDRAETEVANHLVRLGHDIIDRNWKTKYCEIDIISMYQEAIYFTEVKYRKHARQGDGLAAITPTKLRQMTFAVKLYQQKQRITNTNLRLAVASVTGESPAVETWFALD